MKQPLPPITQQELAEQVAGFDAVSLPGPEFADSLTEQAYRDYMQIRAAPGRDGDWHSERSRAAAVRFLSCVCDYYLNKYDGDFIHIEARENWQR